MARRCGFLGACLISLAAIASPVAAEAASDCAPPSADLVRNLLEWIGAETDYDVSASLSSPPSVEFCHVDQAVDYAGATVVVEPDDRGYFVVDSRRILLVQPWSQDDPRDVAILLHELVHDVQFLNRDWPCPNATEWEAYRLHTAWLAERGIEAEVNWFQVYMHSRCTETVHP